MIIAPHWNMKEYMHLLSRDDKKPKAHRGGRLAVLLQLMLHVNHRFRCWPSTETLMRNTGLNKPTVVEARKWLLEHRAIAFVPYDKRDGKEKELPKRQMVYQLTGVIALAGKIVPYMLMSPEQFDAIKAELEAIGAKGSDLELSESELSESEPKGITSSKGSTNAQGSTSEDKNVAPAGADAPNVIPFKDDNPAKPAKPMTDGQRVTALIHAWWDELPVKPADVDSEAIYKNKTSRRYAANLSAAGVTAAGVRCFVKVKTAPGQWYHDKALTFGTVAKDAPAWCRANASQIALYERVNGIEPEPVALPVASGGETMATPEQIAQAKAAFEDLLKRKRA